MRVGVLASGSGTNLQALLDDPEIEVVAVASDKADVPALQRAAGARVPAAVFARDDFDDREARDVAMADWLDRAGVELVVLAGYMQLLSATFLARFPDRVLNVHPSLLPAFPGLNAIGDAVGYGVKVFGVTVHLVDEGVDTGPILLQRSIEIAEPLERDAVHDRLRPLEHALLPEAVRLLARGAVRRDPANPRRLLVDR
ncbi:MAG: phosphoribosylglycinamide formyltransferase [Solirubrobacteraceae bacterium]